ncbi:MAG: ROK family protein [Pseudomonadota bacterium]
MTDTASPLTLVADIGGTNTRVALARGTKLVEGSVKRFLNADYAGLDTVLRTYLSATDQAPVGAACVALAGPVRHARGTLTNLDWTVDAETLTHATQARTVAILNDLQAQGYALGFIAAENQRLIVDGTPQAEGEPQLVIGVGTGFNATPVYQTAAGRFVAPSESGHVNMPIRTEADLRLCHFVETAHGFPAVEDVLSGRGLERIFAWHATEDGAPREMMAGDIMAAVAAGDPTATAAARTFTRLLGTVAGNLALGYLPFGGVYLVGGVARAFSDHLAQYDFAGAFRDKGRFAGFMQNFSVAVIEDDFAALTGCAAHMTRR